MARTVEELVVEWKAQTAQFDQKIKQLVATNEAAGRRIDAVTKRVQLAWSKALSGIAWTALAAGASQYTKKLEDLASGIQDVGDRANISTDFLQQMRFVFEQNGAQSGAFDTAMVKLNKTLGDARNGVDSAKKAFDDLGLSDLYTKTVDNETAFASVTNAIAGMKDESQAAARITDIMGKEADQLVGTMKHGWPEVARMGRELEGMISAQAIKRVADMQDEQQKLQLKMDAIGTESISVALQLREGMLDAIHDLTGELMASAIQMDKWLGLSKQMKGVWGGVENALGLGGMRDLYGDQGKQYSVAPGTSGFSGGGYDVAKPLPATPPPPVYDAAAEALKRLREENERYVAELKFEFEIMNMSEEQREIETAWRRLNAKATSDQRDQVEAFTRALFDNNQRLKVIAATAGTAGKAVADLVNKLEDEAKAVAAPWKDIGKSIEWAFADTFTDIVSGAEEAGDAFKRLGADILDVIAKQLMLQAIQGASQSIFGGGGIGGAIAGVVGGFAAGGTLNPGNAYQLHKNEVVIPHVPMSVIPAGKAGGGGGSTAFSIVINAPGADASTVGKMHQIAAHLKQDILSMMPKVIKESTARGRLSSMRG